MSTNLTPPVDEQSPGNPLGLWLPTGQYRLAERPTQGGQAGTIVFYPLGDGALTIPTELVLQQCWANQSLPVSSKERCQWRDEPRVFLDANGQEIEGILIDGRRVHPHTLSEPSTSKFNMPLR